VLTVAMGVAPGPGEAPASGSVVPALRALRVDSMTVAGTE
jgi:hypothetical protein